MSQSLYIPYSLLVKISSAQSLKLGARSEGYKTWMICVRFFGFDLVFSHGLSQSQSALCHFLVFEVFWPYFPMDKATRSTVFLAPPRSYHPHWSQCSCQYCHTSISDQNFLFCIFIVGVPYYKIFVTPLGHGFTDGWGHFISFPSWKYLLILLYMVFSHDSLSLCSSCY